MTTSRFENTRRPYGQYPFQYVQDVRNVRDEEGSYTILPQNRDDRRRYGNFNIDIGYDADRYKNRSFTTGFHGESDKVSLVYERSKRKMNVESSRKRSNESELTSYQKKHKKIEKRSSSISSDSSTSSDTSSESGRSHSRSSTSKSMQQKNAPLPNKIDRVSPPLESLKEKDLTPVPSTKASSNEETVAMKERSATGITQIDTNFFSSSAQTVAQPISAQPSTQLPVLQSQESSSSSSSSISQAPIDNIRTMLLRKEFGKLERSRSMPESTSSQSNLAGIPESVSAQQLIKPMDLQAKTFNAINSLGISRDQTHQCVVDLFIKTILEIAICDEQAVQLLTLVEENFKSQLLEMDKARLYFKLGQATFNKIIESDSNPKLQKAESISAEGSAEELSSSSQTTIFFHNGLNPLQTFALTQLNPRVALDWLGLRRAACRIFIEMGKALEGTDAPALRYIEIAKQLAGNDADKAKLLLAHVRILYKVKTSGFLDKAIALLHEGLKLNIHSSKKTGFVTHLAEAYFCKPDITPVFQVLGNFLSLPDLSPNQKAQILTYLAKAYLQINKKPQAMEHFKKALEIASYRQAALLCTEMSKAFGDKDVEQAKSADKSKQTKVSDTSERERKSK